MPVEIYQPPMPTEIKTRPVAGAVVMTKNNLAEKIAQVEKLMGSDFVIIGYVPTSYENLAYNLQEMQRYSNQLKEIIIYYRKATQVTEDIDGDGDVDVNDWVLENERLRKHELPDQNH